jgi:hypothetical protein
VATVPQLSLFSAEARPPRPGDLAGLLCGPGQIVRFGTGDTARLSIVLADAARAPAVVALCRAVGIAAEAVTTENGATAVRTAFRRDLVALAGAWTRGAVKTVPAGLQLDGAVLRVWATAAGRWDGRSLELLLDPHAPQTHLPLVAAATRAGVAPARTGRSEPALRVGGARRVRRLVELLGPPPAAVDPAGWPGTEPSGGAVTLPLAGPAAPGVTGTARTVGDRTG